MTLASLRLRISWIHNSCTVVASLLRNFLLSGVGIICLKPLGSHLQISQIALMCFPHFASIEGYANLEGGSDVRFCLKHFRDVTIFSVSNFVILYKIILN